MMSRFCEKFWWLSGKWIKKLSVFTLTPTYTLFIGFSSDVVKVNNGRGYLYELDIAEPIPCRYGERDLPEELLSSLANSTSTINNVRMASRRKEGTGDCFQGDVNVKPLTSRRQKRNLITDSRKFWNTLKIPYQISARLGKFSLLLNISKYWIHKIALIVSTGALNLLKLLQTCCFNKMQLFKTLFGLFLCCFNI